MSKFKWQRNDAKAALEYAAKLDKQGKLDGDIVHVLIMLQDNQAAFIEAFEKQFGTK